MSNIIRLWCYRKPAYQSDNELGSDCDIKPPSARSVRCRVSIPSLPLLEKGAQPNRVELTELSVRIKEKLKPARDELLANKRQSVQVCDQSITHMHVPLPSTSYCSDTCYAM